MDSIKLIKPPEIDPMPGTSAPGFHLSDTLNWSCFSARIKNQVIVVPKYVEEKSDSRHADNTFRGIRKFIDD